MLGQPRQLARRAKRYGLALLPALFGIPCMTIVQRVMTAEGHVFANLAICATVFATAPIWQDFLVYRHGLGFVGAAWAQRASAPAQRHTLELLTCTLQLGALAAPPLALRIHRAVALLPLDLERDARRLLREQAGVDEDMPEPPEELVEQIVQLCKLQLNRHVFPAFDKSRRAKKTTTAASLAEQPAAAPPTNPNKEFGMHHVQVDDLGRTFHERVEVSAALLFRTSRRAVSYLSTILTASLCRVVRFGRGQRRRKKFLLGLVFG